MLVVVAQGLEEQQRLDVQRAGGQREVGGDAAAQGSSSRSKGPVSIASGSLRSMPINGSLTRTPRA
jgi:hypothetical protein